MLRLQTQDLKNGQQGYLNHSPLGVSSLYLVIF